MQRYESSIQNEEKFTPYSFEGVEENANPLEYFNETSDATFNQQHPGGHAHYKRLNFLFSAKEFFDRIGYGFAAHQFITILFFLSGAGPLLVGIIYGFRSALSSLLASLSRAYSKVRSIHPSTIALTGVVFGFSLLGMILGMRIRSPALFATAVLIGSLGVVSYGELYDRLVRENIKHERKNAFLRHITHYGLFITALAFLISGWLFDLLGMRGHTLTVFGMNIPLAGHFVSFELAAICFFISGYFIRSVPLKMLHQQTITLSLFLQSYVHDINEQTKKFFTNKYLFLLYVGSLLIATVEVLGAAYYGYIIFDLYKNTYFGPFLNIAIIFSIAIFASFLGPVFTSFLRQRIGLAPMFVFGALLLAILPLTLLVNHFFFAIIAAVSCGVIGSSILGVAQGLLARKLLPPSLRKSFFQSVEVLLVLPFITLVPLGALLIHLFGFQALYYIIIGILIGLVLPLYFGLVVISNRKRL